jgi:ATP/maltotriose-dependent transcriptional regulator MalT
MRLAVPERIDEDLARHLLEAQTESLADAASPVGLMIQPAQDEQGGYIFQPMLRSYLNKQFKTADPDLYAKLHVRCISWFEERGRYVEAAAYAQQIGDDCTVARIITSHPEQLLQDGNLPLIRLLDRFSDEKWLIWPVLAWMYASVLVHARHYLKAERILDLVDAALAGQEPIRLPSTGEDLRAYLYSTRSRIHMARNESEIGIQYTMRTKDLLGGPGKLHGTLYFNRHTTSILNGPYGFWGILRSSKVVADYVLPRWGRLDAGYCAMLVLDGECRMETGSPEEALPLLNRGLQLALDLREPGLAAPALISLAKLSWSKGDKESAYAILQEGRDHMARMNVRERIHLLDACEIDFRIRETHMKPVRRWLANQTFTQDALLEPYRLMEAIVLLRALFALGRTSQARSYGQRLLRLADSNGLPYRTVEIRLILALNDYVHGNFDLSLEKIAVALQVGMEQGYEQLFVQEGGIVASLLQARLKQYRSKRDKPLADYIRKLLKAFPGQTENAAPIFPNLLAHLSKQETRVCQHIMEGKSNAIIAQSLGISIETVKKHCQNIYRKLGIGNRREMITLLSPP